MSQGTKSNYHCCYGTCKSDSRYDPNIKFYPFPKPCLLLRNNILTWSKLEENRHVKMCKQCSVCKDWMVRCKREDHKFQMVRQITAKIVICHKHFSEKPAVMDYEKYSPLPAVAPESVLCNTLRSSRVGRKSENRRECATRTDVEDSEAGNLLPTEGFLNQSGAEAPSGEFTTQGAGHEVSASEEITPHDVIDQVPSCDLVIEEAQDDLFTIEEMPEVSGDKAIQVDEESLGPLKVFADKAVDVFPERKCRGTNPTFMWKDVSLLHSRLHDYQAEVKKLKGEVADCMKKLSISKIASFEKQLLGDDATCQFYTSFNIPELAFVKGFFKDELEGNIKYWGAQYSCEAIDMHQDNMRRNKRTNCKFTPFQELLLTLVRLRVGSLEEDLAARFDVSTAFVSRVTTTWIQVMYTKFYSMKKQMFASRSAIKKNLPERFRKFKNVRIIIDCAEIFCQRPSNFEHQGNCYSEYKGHSTYKFLIGCAPNGAVTFISHSFEGSKSDRAIVEESGLVEMLEEGDMVLADRGFTITDLTDKKGVVLKIPAFLKGRDKLSPQEEIETKEIAANRIFIEHVVGRVKNFRFLQNTLPLTMRHVISQAVYVCASLLNFREPILK